MSLDKRASFETAPESLPPGETFDPTKKSPCPFCGYEKLRLNNSDVYWMVCDGCDCEGPIAADDLSAITLWNRRLPPPPVSVPASKCDRPVQVDAVGPVSDARLNKLAEDGSLESARMARELLVMRLRSDRSGQADAAEVAGWRVTPKRSGFSPDTVAWGTTKPILPVQYYTTTPLYASPEAALRATAPGEPADASGMTPLDHEARAIFRAVWGHGFGGVMAYEHDEPMWKEAALEVRKVRAVPEEERELLRVKSQARHVCRWPFTEAPEHIRKEVDKLRIMSAIKFPAPPTAAPSPSVDHAGDQKKFPCEGGGGNDVIYCTKCGLEWEYARTYGPAAPVCANNSPTPAAPAPGREDDESDSAFVERMHRYNEGQKPFIFRPDAKSLDRLIALARTPARTDGGVTEVEVDAALRVWCDNTALGTVRTTLRAALEAAAAARAAETAGGAGEMGKRGIYIASKTKHAPLWRLLRDRGLPIISTWIDEAGEGESADLTDLWRRCITEAANAAVLIVNHEPGEVLKGAWAEVGAALASGTPVYAVGIKGEFTIAHAPGITHFAKMSDAVEAAAARTTPNRAGEAP